MPEFKVDISNGSEAHQVEVSGHHANSLVGKKIGDEVDGIFVSLPGYKLQITGGSLRQRPGKIVPYDVLVFLLHAGLFHQVRGEPGIAGKDVDHIATNGICLFGCGVDPVPRQTGVKRTE
ncbi:MAG: S6e family ribosomal protein [Thermoplasmatota archaeon]